jgi:RNA polymerase sigma-70 factor (ECF subfamily)
MDRLPDEAAQNAELMNHITTALDQLPDEQRMAFVLRTVQGLSLDEISSVMQCPVNTVRSRRLLAIRRLRDALRGIMVL